MHSEMLGKKNKRRYMLLAKNKRRYMLLAKKPTYMYMYHKAGKMKYVTKTAPKSETEVARTSN